MRVASMRTGLAFGLAAALAFAANDLQAQAGVGIWGGGISTELSGDDIGDGFSSDGGFVIGAGMDYGINERFSWGWGVSYQERGWNEDGVQKIEADYVGLGISLGVGHQFSESVGGGISVGPTLNLKAKCEVSDDEGTVNCDDGANINPYGIDYGVMGSAGIGYVVNERVQIGVGAGYELGLRPLAQYRNGPRVGEDWEAKWRSMFVGVGIGIAIGGGG